MKTKIPLVSHEDDCYIDSYDTLDQAFQHKSALRAIDKYSPSHVDDVSFVLPKIVGEGK
jgi:hypothetical protein